MASLDALVKPTIFREYIGFKRRLTQFRTDIIKSVDQFHFILAFATERYDETTNKKIGTGTFTAKWDTSSFNAQSIMDLKRSNPNVRVIISIGGRGEDFPFDPTINWVDEAKKSLKENILDQYKDSQDIYLIDGIDVYYDNIINDHEFAKCIGELIKSLKEDDIIKVASISPSNYVLPQYRRLYQNYADSIEWVNYQFYYQRVNNKVEFKNLYNILAADYSKQKLLVGFSADSNDAYHISEEVFFHGCTDLFTSKFLSGISVWDADSSVIQSKPFHVEERAQGMIVHFHRSF